jgi:predicted nucleic acid-binding protein
MGIPTLYIETSTFNFYDSKESKKQQATRALFDWIEKGRFKAFTSEVVIEELSKAEEGKRQKMLDLISRHDMEVLDYDKRAEDLAELYMEKGVIPRKYFTDAWHIAIASVNKLNFVISFNFGHIVKLQTLNMTGLENVRRDYPQLGLLSPKEWFEYDVWKG